MDPVGRIWDLVVRLVQLMFRDGTVPVEIVWAKMVITPKWKREYRGIGLVDILWKVCAVVINCWLKSSGVLHKTLHGFRTWRGTGTATLEANLSQQLVGIAHKPLFQVFLDVRKAYYLLDRERCLELLRGYEMGPNLDGLLENY